MKKLLMIAMMCTVVISTFAKESKKTYIISKEYGLDKRVNWKIADLKKAGYTMKDFDLIPVDAGKRDPYYYKLVISVDDNKGE